MRSAPNVQAFVQLRKISRKDDSESALRPMPPSRPRRTVPLMKRTLLLILVAFGLIMLAVGGWAIQGLRWTLSGGRDRRERLATA
jgi:hypothetical protein